jgi:peptidoglycan/LPS O-acetylase OafA/YrhL
MTRGLSLWLDVLRVWATLVVVVSHVAYPRFTRGDYSIIRDLNLGSDAVIIFFVISGMVIAYAADRDGDIGTFGFKRATRLLSVIVPAIVLTYAFDKIGQRVDPSAYDNNFYHGTSLQTMLLRGVTMSNEWGLFDRVRLGTNGPLWSLSYEAAFYVMFAVAVFVKGPRKFAVLLLSGYVFGPRVLLLMPSWLLGVWLWHWVSKAGPSRLTLVQARVFAIGGPAAYAICLWYGIPNTLAAYTADIFGPDVYRAILGFSDELIWNAMLGMLTALHIAGMARLLNAYKKDHAQVRWWAGASFSIYVTHYPMLHLIDAVFPSETFSRDVLFLVASVSVGLIFAQIFERPLKRIRGLATICSKKWAPHP